MCVYSQCTKPLYFKESTHGRVWWSHVTHLNDCWHTHEWAIAHTWMSHDTHVNGSWHTDSSEKVAHGWVGVLSLALARSHSWMGHGTYEFLKTDSAGESAELCHSQTTLGIHMNESWHTHEWSMTHTWMNHGTHEHLSKDSTRVSRCFAASATLPCPGYTHGRVMAHTNSSEEIAHGRVGENTSHSTHMNESRQTHEWATTRMWTSHVTHKNLRKGSARASRCFAAAATLPCPCHKHGWVMAHTNSSEKIAHRRFGTSRLLLLDFNSSCACSRLVIDMTYTCMTWLIRVWHDLCLRDMTHPFCCYVALAPAVDSRLVSDMTHTYVTWLIRVWHDSFMCCAAAAILP